MLPSSGVKSAWRLLPFIPAGLAVIILNGWPVVFVD
jgi:hypothetical protein